MPFRWCEWVQLFWEMVSNFHIFPWQLLILHVYIDAHWSALADQKGKWSWHSTITNREISKNFWSNTSPLHLFRSWQSLGPNFTIHVRWYTLTGQLGKWQWHNKTANIYSSCKRYLSDHVYSLMSHVTASTIKSPILHVFVTINNCPFYY